MHHTASSAATKYGVREPDEIAIGPGVSGDTSTCAPGDRARAGRVVRRDLSLRLALRFLLLAACAGAVALAGVGEDMATLGKGLAFVLLILALHFMTTPDP